MLVNGYAATKPDQPLAAFAFERRPPGPNDVVIRILYCGICHTDIHQARNEWGHSVYPMVPGHEIVGEVEATGSAVTKFKVGDHAGVGCMVDSCRICAACREGEEQFCVKGCTLTYNSRSRDGDVTYGGYSDRIVVHEDFALRIGHDAAALPGVAPLLCAGITTYSPLRHWRVGPNSKVGIVGLGGLGHMAVKIAHALGAHVVQFTRSSAKAKDALRLGANEAILTDAEGALRPHAKSFDFILDTVSGQHDIGAYLGLLKRDGVMTLVGAPDKPLELPSAALIAGRRNLTGSLIGGIAETQEMLDFCSARQITSEVEVISIQQVNAAFARILQSDVRYRFVIDLASLATRGAAHA